MLSRLLELDRREVGLFRFCSLASYAPFLTGFFSFFIFYFLRILSFKISLRFQNYFKVG